MKQPYFDRHGDLARCSAAQQMRVWSVWSLIHARRAQNLGARPRWRELAICWLLHHAACGVPWLVEIRQRLRRRLG